MPPEYADDYTDAEWAEMKGNRPVPQNPVEHPVVPNVNSSAITRSEPSVNMPTNTSVIHSEKDTEETDFYEAIIKYNIFRELGWRPPAPPPRFRLIATFVYKNPKDTKALIFENTTGKLHQVNIGDKVGSAVVKSIQNKHVILIEGKHKTIELKNDNRIFTRY